MTDGSFVLFSGADVTGLLPKYFTIVRGQLFCGIASLAIVPWKLLSKLCQLNHLNADH